jgi:hypothetical protein
MMGLPFLVYFFMAPWTLLLERDLILVTEEAM